MPDLLIELFSEEIPARMQARAAQDLRKLMTDGLVEAGLTYAHAGAFATPRRLALAIEGLSAQSPTRHEERRGPRTDAPEKAIEGFLRATGLTRDQLQARDDKKGQVFFATIETPGRPAAQIVAEVLDHAIRHFPWPKSMRWGAGALRWVRPLHSILCILTDEAGTQVVPLDVDGITAGDTTRGHRFMAPDAFAVTGFEDYQTKLRRAFVMLDPQARADHIRAEAQSQAFALGLELVEDPALLAEVAGLVEWPVVLVGQIGADFLTLPPEVLQTSMKEHQKFFSLRDPRSGQIVRFVTVANRDTVDGGQTILAGNQKVLAARLSDARFFWENDLRKVREAGLEGMAEGLANVTFHNKLGTQKDRILRIEAQAREIAPLVGADPEAAALAARVAKADLRSEMVGEFPELQGVMGVYYARAQGLPKDVALACKEHYQPLGPGDAVPSSPVSVAVALADKIDTLTGFWAIDEKPTGSKDPYALRRAVIGAFRLMLQNNLRISLSRLVREAYQNILAQWAANGELYIDNPEWIAAKKGGQMVPSVDPVNDAATGQLRVIAKGATAIVDLVTYIPSTKDWQDNLLAFIHDRLKVHLRDQGIRHDVIDACLAMPGNDDLTLLIKRAEALSTFLQTDDGENLVQGFRRANNLLTQAEAKDGVEYSFGPDPKLAETPEETALFTALDKAEATIAPAMGAEDFATAMTAMARLRAPIDAFFEAVKINADNAILRRNRLNLLHRIRSTCLQVADLTRLEG
ncbi:glycine--tRNA ligase subunit beta [Rhodobacteraceae bacterium 2376]|uniref:Glycine--tRNA ligase beta subunit n=1 Tax=Rhabdonatronobacter sediminivivens TaxID=2743469 RepID=A0A7Z0KXI9_9RHOB|nr:glycine--tRNA ligase subunit beta [Rhabdonatronobacter sediminivivens]NYS24922.1 glycine--tRNA ligase subunit beta [Rhabdonatronobacter sediminivivens]